MEDTQKDIFDKLDSIHRTITAFWISAAGVLGSGLVAAVIYIASQLGKRGTP